MRERWTRTAPVLAVSEDEVRAMLRPALGDVSIAALEPLSGGHSNTNIRVRLSGAPHAVVLRLYQRDPAQARKEAAIAKLVAGRVPAPAYLHCGTFGDCAYAVVEAIDGAPLQTRLRGASEGDLGFAGREIGRALAAIHGFTFPAAGFLDGELKRHTVSGRRVGGGVSGDDIPRRGGRAAGTRSGRRGRGVRQGERAADGGVVASAAADAFRFRPEQHPDARRLLAGRHRRLGVRGQRLAAARFRQPAAAAAWPQFGVRRRRRGRLSRRRRPSAGGLARADAAGRHVGLGGISVAARDRRKR